MPATPSSDQKPPEPSAVPDVLAPGLRVVFCGINPGRRSAAAGAHFANPRNDFWRLLHDAGFTPRLLAREEQHELSSFGYGLTYAAYRTTKGSSELRRADFAGAADRLQRLGAELRPEWLAFVGKAAYQGAFGARPELGVQERRLGETQRRRRATAEAHVGRAPERVDDGDPMVDTAGDRCPRRHLLAAEAQVAAARA
jgi:double-stranded uracil-DNA glycosylase